MGHPLEDAMKTLTRRKETLARALGDAFWVGTNLHRLRLEKSLTQEGLAAAAGLTARRLRDIENAALESNIRLETLSALARALGVKTEVLFKRHKGVEALALQI
jgi:transcriptional regulator with XRE-family HTH domain